MTSVPDRPQAGLSRRSFLFAGAAAGGGLLIGVSFAPAYAKKAANQTFAPNAFIRIETDGTIVLTMPYVEMGQGTYTSVPMLIAEELEVGLDSVELEHAPANDAKYAHPIMGAQETDGSLSMRAAWDPIRQAGAAARTMLISAVAARWGVGAADCHADSGFVVHGKSARRIG